MTQQKLSDVDIAARAKYDAQKKANDALAIEIREIAKKAGLCGCNREHCTHDRLWFEIKRLRAAHARLRELAEKATQAAPCDGKTLCCIHGTRIPCPVAVLAEALKEGTNG